MVLTGDFEKPFSDQDPNRLGNSAGRTASAISTGSLFYTSYSDRGLLFAHEMFSFPVESLGRFTSDTTWLLGRYASCLYLCCTLLSFQAVFPDPSQSTGSVYSKRLTYCHPHGPQCSSPFPICRLLFDNGDKRSVLVSRQTVCSDGSVHPYAIPILSASRSQPNSSCCCFDLLTVERQAVVLPSFSPIS